MFQKIYDSLLSLAYPQICQVCKKIVEHSADGVACSDCWNATDVFNQTETLCAKCSRFLHSKITGVQTFCHLCDTDFYDAARAVGLYEKALAASILNLKREPFVAHRLKNLLTAAFEKTTFYDADIIIPVPLSKKRRLERGFNQAEVLAEIIAKRSGLKLDQSSLIRKIHTPMHRVAMDRKARELTVENAFEVLRPKLIKNQKILLIDDVFTSGATVSHCAKTLKKNGADKVYVFTIARVR